MKQLLVFLTLAVLSASASLLGWSGGLRVRFGIGTNYFYNLPVSASDAAADGWSRSDRPAGPLDQLELYCYESRVVCTLYDDTGYIAGLQVAFLEDEFTNAVFDWEVQGYTKWTPSDDGKSYWTIQQYFVTEEFLSTSSESRLAARDSSRLLQLDGIWVTGNNRQLVKIANTTAGVEDSEFTQQACIPLMGRHFYYDMSADLTCSAETLFPWFPLVHSGELVATGLVAYGQLPEDEQRDFFERPDRSAVKMIVPRGPECLYDLADSPGLVTIHIYYIDKPWLLTCLLQ